MPPFSDVVMDHFLHPRGAGLLAEPSGVGWSGSVEAHRYMRIQVQVEDGHVIAATFGTYGCAPAIAAGSWVCDWITGRTVTEAQQLTADTLNGALGGLPEGRRFCANLAVDALQSALLNAMQESRGDPSSV